MNPPDIVLADEELDAQAGQAGQVGADVGGGPGVRTDGHSERPSSGSDDSSTESSSDSSGS
eukprot:12344098-Alexandrium_andersonii.AAC.1